MPDERSRSRVVFVVAALLLAQCTPGGEEGSARPSLTALADAYGTDKGSRVHRFTEIYEAILAPRRQEELKILEIGVRRGASLRMWRDFFPRATVVGLDIKPRFLFEEERITTMLADQAKREELQAVIDRFGSGFDVVLDDGGHQMDQQQISLGFLFPHVAPGGHYILEDLHTSTFETHGADPSQDNTSLRMLFDFIWGEGLHSQYMSEEEMRYLEENIEYVNLFHRATHAELKHRVLEGSTTAIIQKKR